MLIQYLGIHFDIIIRICSLLYKKGKGKEGNFCFLLCLLVVLVNAILDVDYAVV